VSDTWLLWEALEETGVEGAAVADLCTGSGALAIAAATHRARRVVAADVSRRSILATRINARLNGCSVQTRRGDLAEVLGDEMFDLIVCNPPYIPAETDSLPRHRSTTPLDGGRDGRALLDRFCHTAPRNLLPGGSLLVVHSSICGTEQTCSALREEGLEPEVVRRVPGTLGPVLRARAAMLRERGLLGERDEEELVVVRGVAASGKPVRSREHVTVTPYRDGPYLVRGPFQLVDQDGHEITLPARTIALCRCGRSQTRPSCDGTHKTVGFSAASGPEADAEPSARSDDSPARQRSSR